MNNKKILLTGANGYIGGRLLGKLIEKGYSVRCMARRPEELQAKYGSAFEVCYGDVLKSESLKNVFDGVDVAYYLIHSMGAAGDFSRQDRLGATHFSRAAKENGVKRIIYLGGLADKDSKLSKHLASRLETGEILRSSGVPTLEFQASIIIGSGSLSFELVRALVERLPVMITPKWVSVKAQPISIIDVIDYLAQGVSYPSDESRMIEIGGKDVCSYADLMREYARQRGFKRFMIPVPFLTPYLSSLWLGLVTPVFARIGKKLIDSVKNPTVISHPDSASQFSVRPMSMREAMALALKNEEKDFAETRWSDALSSSGYTPSWGGVRFGNRLVDTRTVRVPVSCEQAFKPIQCIGGKTGWYFGNIIWKIRGFLDLLVGGVGIRRGRKHIRNISIGDTIDWWRVEAYEPNRRLKLIAEMKLPGRAWLEFEVTPDGNGALVRQTAIFDPLGLSGLLYWYMVYPLHICIFKGMLARIAQAVKRYEA